MTEDKEIRYRQLTEKLEKLFLLHFDSKTFFQDINSIAIEEEVYYDIFQSLNHNLQSSITVATTPVELAFKRSYSLLYSDIYKEFGNPYKEPARTKQQIKDDVEREFQKHIKTPQGNKDFWEYTLDYLSNSFIETSLEDSAKEIINLCTISIWTAFEVFCRDIFVRLLNSHPNLVKKINENTSLQQRFKIKHISTETLIKYHYNLSSNMGSLLIENYDFSNLGVIRSIFDTLFNSQKIAESFEHKNILWTLYQRRNLIVHRRGIVDQQYLENTSDKIEIGTKLYVSPQQLSEYLEIVKKITLAIKGELN